MASVLPNTGQAGVRTWPVSTTVLQAHCFLPNKKRILGYGCRNCPYYCTNMEANMLVYFQKLCRNFQCNSILSCSAVSYFLSISSGIYLGISCCHPPLQLFLLLQEKCAHIFKNCLGKQRKRCKVVPQSTSAAPRDKLLSLPLQSASGQPHDTAQHEDRHDRRPTAARHAQYSQRVQWGCVPPKSPWIL